MTPAGTGAEANGGGERSEEVRSRVAWACRILASEGYQDLTLGHVSARDPERPGRMWIKRRGVTLGEVTPAEVIEFELGADLRDASDEMHLEAVLHTEVYGRREDVGAIVHGHPPYATAFAATDADLLHLTHDAVMFDRGLAIYEGPPDLITEPEQAETIIAGGEADAVSLARAMLYDPRWPWHAAARLGARVAAPHQYWRSQPREYKDLFESAAFGARCAYTMDGSSLGEIQDETFSALEATLTVTRDYGAEVLLEATREDPPESETVMRMLDSEAEIETRYGGGLVQSIEGISGSTEVISLRIPGGGPRSAS